MSDVKDDPAAELRRFARLVASMRVAQRKWFQGDTSLATLTTAKNLERQVDRVIAAVLDDSARLFE